MFKKVRYILFRNWGLKILALAFAFVMWIFVTIKTPHEEIPVEAKLIYKNSPKDLVLLNDAPQSLLVRVSGPRLVLKALRKRTLYYEIDLKGIRAGNATFTVVPSKIDGLPVGIQVVSINPSYFTLIYDTKLSKVLNVNPVIISEPKKGYRITSVQVVPKRIEVSGPKNILKSIDTISTEPVDITDASFTIEKEVALDRAIKGLEFASGDVVKISIQIEPVWVSREFKGVPITIVNTSYRYMVKPDKLDIRLTVMEAVANEITPESIQLYIDASGLKAGEYIKKPLVKLPEEMMLQKQPLLPDVKLRLWEATPEIKAPLNERKEEPKK